MGKNKKEKKIKDDEGTTMDESIMDETTTGEISYEEKLQHVSAIAQPMANKKLTSRIYKLIKKASKQKSFVINGIKSVQTKIRKGEKGIVIMAGNVSPIEVMCHLPAVCEELGLPYIYTPSREDIGAAMGVKRTCLVVMIKKHADYIDTYDKVEEELLKVPPLH